MSGPAGAVLKAGVEAVQVWAQWVNDRGGLGGHTVRLLVADDGGDPARHRALLQELVEKQGAIGFVQNQEAYSGAAAAEYPNRKGVPVINTEGGGNYVYESPMYFPVLSSGDEFAFALVASYAAVAIPAGRRKLAIITCAEATSCRQFQEVWASDRAHRLGFQTVYRATASLVQPDFTAECVGARSAGADVLAIGMDNNSVARIAASCHRQGFFPLIGLPDLSAVDSVRESPELQGAVVGSHAFAWPSQETPGMQEFHAVFARYRPGLRPGGAHAVGWTAAKALERAASALPEPPTTAALLAGLHGLDGDDLGGLTYPLRFTPGHPAERRACWSVVVIEKREWTAPLGGRLRCAV